jgi:hypothetical protein
VIQRFGALIRTLITRCPEYAKLIGIPVLLFALDFVLRVVIHVDVNDAGADMALLAMGLFAAILGKDTKGQTSSAFVGFVVTLILWIICLGIITNPSSTLIIRIFDPRGISAGFVGGLTLIGSCIWVNERMRLSST